MPGRAESYLRETLNQFIAPFLLRASKLPTVRLISALFVTAPRRTRNTMT